MKHLSALELKLATRHVLAVVASGSPGTTTGNSIEIRESMNSSHGSTGAEQGVQVGGYVHESRVSMKIKIGKSRPKSYSVATFTFSTSFRCIDMLGYAVELKFHRSSPNISLLSTHQAYPMESMIRTPGYPTRYTKNTCGAFPAQRENKLNHSTPSDGLGSAVGLDKGPLLFVHGSPSDSTGVPCSLLKGTILILLLKVFLIPHQ